MSRLGRAALLFGLVLFGVTPSGAEEPVARQWNGSLRSLNLTGAQGPGGLFPDYRLSSTRLRLETTWHSRSNWRVEAAADHQLLGTDPAGIVPLPGDGVNRRVDLDHSWQHDDGWASRLQIDRFNLAWTKGWFDGVIGRQAIGFGRIVIFSPLDIIAPFPPDALDTDTRPGVDALRLTANYGQDGQFGAVAVLGDTSSHDSYLVTLTDNWAGIDLLAMGGTLRERPMLGAGMAGSLGTLGIKGEAAFYEGEKVGEVDGDLHRHMLVSAFEAWYRFDNGLTVIAQYLHNGAGTATPANYRRAALSAPVREGLTSLLGRNYLMAAPSYELHPLITLNGLLIWNLDDDSWLFRPTLDINLADNLALQLFWTHPEGREPETAGIFTELRSEFGSQGDSGGFFVKWYF
jgi:hypothetical protein